MSQQQKKVFLRNFSETLRTIRMRQGWTQGELAQKLEVSAGAVANWEAMINGPTRSRIRDISERLNVSIDYLTMGPDGALLGGKASSEEPPLRQDIIEHMEAFLHRCGDDQRRLAWALIQLQTHLPLDKWTPPPEPFGRPNYKEVASIAEASMDDAADAAGLRGRVRKPAADAPSARKHKPGSGAGEA